ncbi:MAG: hypothetical protein IJD54_04000 [Clostridia bacterium]|nr:hypothetical protein [Clostridia bacterium]
MNKKKETEEVLKTFLESCVKEINEEFERELFVKRSHVENAEKRLTETFSDEQKKLFDEWIIKRDELNNAYLEYRRAKQK